MALMWKILGIASLYHAICWMAYGLTRSGWRVNYIAPMSARQEVTLVTAGLFFSALVAFTTLAGICATLAVGRPAVTAVTMLGTAGGLCAWGWRTLPSRYRHDVRAVRRLRARRRTTGNN